MGSRKAKVAAARAKGKAMTRAAAKQLDLVPREPESPRGKGRPGKAAAPSRPGKPAAAAKAAASAGATRARKGAAARPPKAEPLEPARGKGRPLPRLVPPPEPDAAPSPPEVPEAPAPRVRRATAEQMAQKQREISISEFFTKNRHLLGFDNPSKALLTTIKEVVDNSLDACEEAGILPEITVEVRDLAYEGSVRAQGQADEPAPKR
ncbi:MAG TPA: hypothetical protein VEP68_09025, partial [Anaeromyxobacteraceae bacterium]|nr:hypothetical protein [Anaeromyxobacteraceae bacterium]